MLDYFMNELREINDSILSKLREINSSKLAKLIEINGLIFIRNHFWGVSLMIHQYQMMSK